MSRNPTEKRARYGLFVLAAAFYIVGVLAFSLWSYARQRANILAQVDQSLINATHTAEQILGDVFIACAVETASSSALNSTGNQSNLDRFAENCHFDLLAAVAVNNGVLKELITGGRLHNKLPARTSCPDDLIQIKLTPLILQLAEDGAESIRLETVALENFGQMHVAVRYCPLSGNTGYSILVARNTDLVTQSINLLAIRSAGIGVLLYAMAFPLIVLYHFTRTRALRETAELHERLRHDYVQLKERESELEDAIRDLERFNTLTIGREERIIELKAEVNTLLQQMGQQKRYNVDHVD